jgi:hypothetical protein
MVLLQTQREEPLLRSSDWKGLEQASAHAQSQLQLSKAETLHSGASSSWTAMPYPASRSTALHLRAAVSEHRKPFFSKNTSNARLPTDAK